MRTWNVIEWRGRPENVRKIELACPQCGTDAALDVGDMPGALLVAAVGLTLVFDPPGYTPPDGAMPQKIRCRTCRTLFSDEKEPEDVR